jgi:tetratricopeptide (TPR) repeat protein
MTTLLRHRWLGLAVLLACLGFPGEAQAQDATACANLAAKHVEQGKYARAEDALTRALKVGGPNADLLYKRGFVRLQLGRREPALQDMTAATTTDPALGYAWNGLGAARYVRGQYAPALEALAQAEKLRPGDMDVILNRGLVHLEEGDMVGAEVDLDAVLTASPDDARAQAAMARLEARRTEAEQRAAEAATDASGGVKSAMAFAQKARNALARANEARNVAAGGLGGLLGRLQDSLSRTGSDSQSQEELPPYALDRAGRITPALSYAPAEITPPPAAEGTTPATETGPGTENPPPPAAQDPGAFATEQTAIMAVVAKTAQALEARDVEQATACFEATVQANVRETLNGNTERLPQLAALLRAGQLTYVSAETEVEGGGKTRTAELTVVADGQTDYVQLVKLDGQWWLRSL